MSLSLLSNGSNKCENAFVKYTASDSSVKNWSSHICTHRCSIYQTCNSWTDVHIFKFWPTADPNTISPGIQYYEWQQGYGDSTMASYGVHYRVIWVEPWVIKLTAKIIGKCWYAQPIIISCNRQQLEWAASNGNRYPPYPQLMATAISK